MNEKYCIYNKSSEDMSECESDSVDLVITSPPYNIGTRYGNNGDQLTFENYRKMIVQVISECYRVLKSTGKMVVEVADSVVMGGKYIQLARMIQDILLKKKFFIVERHINFIKTTDGREIADHDWNEQCVAHNQTHSNCHQWLVLSKKAEDFKGGSVFYINYEKSKDHPCPIPNRTCQILLKKYFKTGNVVLDPFMGTASLGVHVIRRGGWYIGYEIDRTIYAIAKLHILT